MRIFPVFAVSLIVVLGGCAGHHLSPEAQAEADALAAQQAGELAGSGDESGQSGASEDERAPKVALRTHPERLFSALDLATPSEVRLASGAPGSEYWQQQVDYTIDATLDAEAQHLNADMDVLYYNNSPDTLTFMWIQLDQNLFRDDSLGTLSRSAGGVMREADEPLHGGYTITSVRSGDEELELTVYGTLGRMELTRAIEPGERFEFSMTYEFDMPPHLRRMGSEEVEAGTIFEYAQWIPQVCVYDDVYGWNTMPYLGTGEFYTNYGDFDVTLTVPRDHLVAATGMLLNPEEVLTSEQQARLSEAKNSAETVMIRTGEEVADPASRPEGDGPLTWKFRAEKVRTFAWASSPSFLWDACAATIEDTDGSQRTVLCDSMYPAEATAWGPDAEQGGASQYVRHAIEFYSDWLYPYPYAKMTNINGPEGGMEYPMIVFCGSRKGRGPYGVTDHEVGHSWFPMIVNTNERRHIWMDEGFNTFVNGYSNKAFRAEQGEEDGGSRGRRRGRFGSRPATQPIVTPPDHMSGRNVGRLGYGKTGQAMSLLRDHVLGEERFDKAFQEYIRRWVFKSPQPADFFRTMEDAAGVDLAWFWREWFYEMGQFDLGITNASVSKGTLRFIVNSYGEQVMPSEYEVTFSDGTRERHAVPVESWFSTNEKLVKMEVGDREVVRVAVDPDEVLPDLDRDDNVWEPYRMDDEVVEDNGAS